MSGPSLPDIALDDRLAIVGTSGSGKTYAAKGFVERLLDQSARVCVVDPLGVWWGLRSSADGKKPGYSVIVFGGKHADVPIGEGSGAALARLIAGQHFSCIIDLGDFGTGAARRRFMIAFLETLYDCNEDPLHLVLDEADLWAPQRPMPDQMNLLNRTEEIVRRGRVRGFIPWLITQRPAVVHKDVLSQADGLVALKLTSSQDRDALGAWIEGQADKAEEKRIRGALPGLQKGEGFVWLPTHGVLRQVTFPKISTFDSSRTPKRGERVVGPTTMAALDLEAIKSGLAEVQAEVDANDPKVLRARIAELERRGPIEVKGDTDVAYSDGHAKGHGEGWSHGYACGWSASTAKTIDAVRAFAMDIEIPPVSGFTKSVVREVPRAAVPETPSLVKVATGLEKRQQRVLDSVAWWNAAGITTPSRPQIAGVAGYAAGSGNFNNILGSLSSAGLIEYPGNGIVQLTAAGRRAANAPPKPTSAELHQRVQTVLDPRHWKLLEALLRAYPRELTRDELAKRTDYAAGSGNFNNLLGRLSSLEMVTYPRSGSVKAADWLFI